MISHSFTNFETTNLRIQFIYFLCSVNVNNIQIRSFKKIMKLCDGGTSSYELINKTALCDLKRKK